MTSLTQLSGWSSFGGTPGSFGGTPAKKISGIPAKSPCRSECVSYPTEDWYSPGLLAAEQQDALTEGLEDSGGSSLAGTIAAVIAGMLFAVWPILGHLAMTGSNDHKLGTYEFWFFFTLGTMVSTG